MNTDLNGLSILIGALISFSLEKTGYYKDETNPAAVKIGLVLFFCVLWAAIVSFLTIDALPTTFIAWRDFVLTLVLTGASSQAFHQAVNEYLPSLGGFAIAMRSTTTVASSSSKTTSDSAGMTTKETVDAEVVVPRDLRTTPPTGTLVMPSEVGSGGKSLAPSNVSAAMIGEVKG